MLARHLRRCSNINRHLINLSFLLRRTNDGLMLAHRLRRCSNIYPPLCQVMVFGLTDARHVIMIPADLKGRVGAD